MADHITAPQAPRTSWRRILKRLGTVALAVQLAACATIVPRTAPPADEPPPSAQPGRVTPGLPSDANRHRVALLVPQTGPNAAVGQSIANMTMMALLDSRSERLRITTYDTGAGAAAAAQQAIADGNKLILGPLVAENVRIVAPIARAAHVPILSFSNDASVAGDGVYLLGNVPGQAVSRVTDYASGQGLKRFAALAPVGAYGDRSLSALREAVSANGAQLVATESFERSATGLIGAIRRLSRGPGYDALIIADGAATAMRAAPLIRRDASRTARLMGTELWNTEGRLSSVPALRGAWFASVSDDLYSQLATKYRQRYGAAPHRISSLGYDAVLLAVLMSNDWRPGTNFPVNRLNKSEGFAGIDGIFRFDSRGIAQRALEVSEVRANGFAVISPAPQKW